MSFASNPQIQLTVHEVGEDDDDGLAQVVIGLMQKDRRKARAKGQGDLDFAIGYQMYQVCYKTLQTFC